MERDHPRTKRIIFVEEERIFQACEKTHIEYFIPLLRKSRNIRIPFGGPPPGSRTSRSDWPTRKGDDPHPRGSPSRVIESRWRPVPQRKRNFDPPLQETYPCEVHAKQNPANTPRKKLKVQRNISVMRPRRVEAKWGKGTCIDDLNKS